MAEDVHQQMREPVIQGSQQAWKQTNTVFTNAKAGMDGVDKDRVKKVIYEMSRDSPHFRNEQRKQQQTDARISRLLSKAKSLTAQELAGHTRKADEKMARMVAERDLTRTWIHVDMDAFFASVEELHDPKLKQVPMGVGGIGMLSTTNYVARKFGVRSAMPGFIALKLCPNLVFVKPNFQRYSEASHQVMDVLRSYDENLHTASLDEAHLDVTDYCETHELTGREVAEQMRATVFEKTGLTCSCGIAPNRMLAKICSDINKPNGQCAVGSDPEDIKSFMAALPIRKIPGVGKVAEQQLNALGIRTCADLLRMRGTVSALFSEITADFTLAAALGLGSTTHQPASREGEVSRKGIGCERTFAVISQTKDLEAKCCELAAKLADDMQREDLKAKTLTLKLKPPTFELRTRAVTLPGYISTAEEIQTAALGLLRAELPISVRLMGLRMSTFLQTAPQPGQRSMAAFLKPKQGGKREVLTAEPGDEASEDDSEEAPVQKTSLEQPQDAAQTSTKLGKTWSCSHCTFAENSHHFLRCMICDSRRGTVPDDTKSLLESRHPHQSNLGPTSEADSHQVHTVSHTSSPLAPVDVANTGSPSNPKEGYGKSGAAYDRKHEVNKKERQNMRKRKPDSAVSIKRFFQSQASKS